MSSLSGATMINHANHAFFHYASDWPSQHIHVKVLLISGVTSSATMSSKMLTASSQPWLSAHALIIGLYVRTSGLRPAAFKLLRKSSRSAPRKRLRFDGGGGTSKLQFHGSEPLQPTFLEVVESLFLLDWVPGG